MENRSRKTIVMGVTAVLLLVAGVLGTAYHVRRPRLTPALRGYEVAEELGCFACHGTGGTGGTPNPGSDVKEVPAWDGGNAMMYVQNEKEIHEWILDGRPERLRKEAQPADTGSPQGSRESPADKIPGKSTPLLKMPAYRNTVSGEDLLDLVAYYKAVAAFEPLPLEARKGYAIAARLGCFGCHGPGGRVGRKNPKSFKGYIPPWRGEDFNELVTSDDELRRWILDGKIERLESNPLARYFTRRQVIKMPAYKELVGDEELNALVGYIHWLQKKSP
jgi:mono/diheme cytochrome c family protein